ncbi:MAG: AAA domain-containing protein [Candidatus Nanoarchaeia archaeon]|nr:AAA domain-containing protein [Candidatus Nanoarchaeia archaeon]
MAHYIDSIEEFHSLLDYYISCLEKEEKLALNFDYRLNNKKFYSNIFKKEQFFSEKKEQIEIKKTPETESIFKDYKLNYKDVPISYGYPLFMDSNGKVSPIFYVEILEPTFDEKEGKLIFTKGDINPTFNHYILSKHHYEIEEINRIRAEIDEEKDFSIKLSKIVRLLNLDEKAISPELEQTPMMVTNSPQLINKAILYFGGKMGFTKGLVDELRELKKKSKPEIETTSLGFLFGKEKLNDKEKPKEMLEVFNLNESQEKGVKGAFSNDISVITGPPGTGKSQVVLNILANAVWNNKTVLFASKNNQAVNVVNDKLKGILSKELVVRMGSSNYRKKAKLQISNLFQNKSSLNVSSNFEESIRKINKINEETGNLKQQIENMSRINEEIEELEKEIASLAEELPEKLYSQCKYSSFREIIQFELEGDIKNNFRNNSLIKKIIKQILPSFYPRKEQAIFKKYYSLLSNEFKEYIDRNIKLDSEDIEKTMRWILCFKHAETIRKEINSLKDKLNESDSLYALYSKINKIREERIEASRNIFENYWFKKLKQTTARDEAHVSRYIDASEKLEKYIDDYPLWKGLVEAQRQDIQEMLSFLPVWIVTNLSAKNSLPLKEKLFDLLIIDEASQCDIASALPLFYRAKKVVIIGDPKQLKHISLLEYSEDKKIASENKMSKLYLDYAYSKNSLYDISERTINSKNRHPTLLNLHYRSHKDIINFSNEHFYDRKLDIMTDENRLISNKTYPGGIHWVNVKGNTQDRRNNEEANKAVNIIKEIRDNKVSVGVVTLFKNQMELITNRINKTEELKDMDIKVGTAHRFQGDEKDIIIFSPAISPNIQQKTLNWVHTTTQLLNVAITRARSILIIVGDRKKCQEAGGILKSLADYCIPKEQKEINFDSPIEHKLYKRLEKDKIKFHYQYETKVKGSKLYRLDFALFVNKNKYDIEIDGDKAHSQKVESDNLRDTHLRLEDWKIRRYRVVDIQNNIDKVMEDIKRLC